MSGDDTADFVAVAAAAGAAVIYSLCGFGSAIIFQVVWALSGLLGVAGAGAIEDGVSYTVITVLASNMVSFFFRPSLRGTQNWPLAACLGTGQLLGYPVGYYLLYAVHSESLKRSMGGLFLLVVLYKAWRKYQARHEQAEDRGSVAQALVHERFDTRGWRRRLALVAVGTCSGVTAGMYGCAGPPLMVFVAFSRVDPHEWRGTTAAMTCVVGPLAAFYLLNYKAEVPADWAVHYSTVVAGSCLGLALGSVLGRHVPTTRVKDVVLGLLFLGSVPLLAGDDRELAYDIMSGLVVATLGCGLAYACKRALGRGRVGGRGWAGLGVGGGPGSGGGDSPDKTTAAV